MFDPLAYTVYIHNRFIGFASDVEQCRKLVEFVLGYLGGLTCSNMNTRPENGRHFVIPNPDIEYVTIFSNGGDDIGRFASGCFMITKKTFDKVKENNYG